MSEFLTWQLQFLVKSLFMGLFLRSLYDILIVLRRLSEHGTVRMAVEDFFYWTGCALCIFTLFYYENDGMPRGFAAAGIILGMLLYHFGPSGPVCFILEHVLRFLLKPFQIIWDFFAKLRKKLLKRRKKSDRIEKDSSQKRKIRGWRIRRRGKGTVAQDGGEEKQENKP